jgi:hypothetical protein
MAGDLKTLHGRGIGCRLCFESKNDAEDAKNKQQGGGNSLWKPDK